MILDFFGLLVDPTDRYLSKGHRDFSIYFVKVITTIVGSVTPLAFLIVGYWLLGLLISLPYPHAIHPHLVRFIAIWASVEVLWYFYCLFLRRRFGVQTSFPGLKTEERDHYLERVLEHCKNPRKALTRWFYTHKEEEVGQYCLSEWISWAFFSKNKVELNENENEELESLVQRLVDKYPEVGNEDPEHVKKDPRFMRLHFDKLIVQHKPFVAYAAIGAMQLGGSFQLQWMGFKQHGVPGTSTLSYWSYDPENKMSGKDEGADEGPIVLLPGIGIGVTMYASLVRSIRQLHPSRPVFILELPHISLKVLHSVPSHDQTVAAMDFIYERHGLNGRNCSFVAHSYGSIVAAWILKQRPTYISKLCMVDPVCFALWEPDLIYNFLYRVPSKPIERLCQFFVAQDMLVAFTLFRNFWWLQNILFPEDLKILRDSSVFLSSHDFIIDAPEVYGYLKDRMDPGKVSVMNGMSHGSFLNSSKFTEKIVTTL